NRSAFAFVPKIAMQRPLFDLTAHGFVQSRVSRLFISVTLKLLRGLLRAGMRASAASSTDVLFADSVLWEKKNRFLVTFCRSAKSYPLAAGQRKLLICAAVNKTEAPPSPPALSRQRERGKITSWIPA